MAERLVDPRLGDWREVLADVECDVACFDPPYSARTHAGQRTGSSIRTPTRDGSFEIAEAWSTRTRFWSIIFCDFTAARWHEEAWLSCGWYVFTPLPYVKDVYAPRLSGDGPATGAEWIIIARPKRRLPRERMGSRPGWYMAKGRHSCDTPAGIAGQKDVNAVRAILSDYTLPGDLVADAFLGSGTTLLAAAIEGRRAVGSEVDPSTYAKAVKRLSAGYTPAMFTGTKTKQTQGELI